MTTPTLTPTASAKTRFMQSGVRVSDHRSLIHSDQFEKSADAAMLTYCESVSQSTNANEAMANGLKIQGAHEFLKIFKLLAEPLRLPTPTIRDNLDPKA